MGKSDIVSDVADVLNVDQDRFMDKVKDDSEFIKSEIYKGTFDNAQSIIGLEYELYSVDSSSYQLKRFPRRILSLIGFEKELGLHNIEMNTNPQPLNKYGLKAQEMEVKSRVSTAINRTKAEDIKLVSDGIWTIPPIGESSVDYLTKTVKDDGINIGVNMSDSARYHAMANTDVSAGMEIDTSFVSLSSNSIMPESLITSIQPHYQVPRAIDLPVYFRYAIRIAGPLLALAVNSPFFPPDLYDEGVNPEEILDGHIKENRIKIFETVMNPENDRKVKFPEDIGSIEEAIDRIVEDKVFAAMPVNKGNRFDDEFVHFKMKHGTYWRWIRPVFTGKTRSQANSRIEFRPLPSQPTIRDTIAFQIVFAGFLEKISTREHPVKNLGWEDAKTNFYSAMKDGFDADLKWITKDGDKTDDNKTIFKDILDTSKEGLERSNISERKSKYYLQPIRSRVQNSITPASWKHKIVKREIQDGKTLKDAIYKMQHRYIENQEKTLIEGSFLEWT